MNAKVPFLDLHAGYRELQPELDAAVLRVAGSGYYILGPELDAFERAYAKFIGVRHCIGVANGLDALHLGLRALGVGPGDEVIVPSFTFVATWLAVTYSGARPVPVECDPDTCNLDVARLKAAITGKTKAIIPVHLYGQPADMSAINEIADTRGIPVLEDAAQAHGASFEGRNAGALGRMAAWSFYPGKNLGALGDGGALTTDDDALAAVLRSLRNYGSATKYHHERIGYNSRLDEVQAAILRVKLKSLMEWNERRRRLAARYDRELAGADLIRPAVIDGAEPVWHLYVIRSSRRDALRASLAERGVDTIIHYPIAPHRQEAYAGAFAPDAFPIAQSLADEVLSLPMGPHLTDEMQTQVIEAVLDVSGA